MKASTVTTPSDFELLVRAYQSGLWRYLRFLGCDESLAEDLVQETFLAAYRKPPAKRDAAGVSAYLRTIARNKYMNATRGAKTSSRQLALYAAEQVWADCAEEDGGARYLDALRACLKRLNEKPKLALNLLYKERLPLETIAGQLNLSAQGVKTLLRRSKEMLRDCIERGLEAEGRA